MVSPILGPDGRPLRKAELTEPQTARIAGLQTRYADHPTRGLTPAKLADLYSQAEQGLLSAQADLAEDFEEKDAHIFAELGKRKLALLTVPWALIPPQDATESEKTETAELESYLRDEVDFDQLLLDLGCGILPGYAAIELEWAQSENQWQVNPQLRPHNWFTVTQADRNTLLLSTAGTSGEPLRPWGWIDHRHPAKSGYLTRSGLVRVLGFPYLFRNLSARDLAEFLEIYGLPLRLGRYPAGATQDEKSTLLAAVVNIGHNAAGILPEGMRIDFQEAAKGAADPFLAMMSWAERSVSKAILGSTLTSEVGTVGSLAAAQVHDKVRHDILKADLRLIARSLSRDLLTPLAALRTRMRKPPTLRFEVLDPEEIKSLAESLPNLVAVGLRVPTRWVYSKLGVPEPQAGEPVLGENRQVAAQENLKQCVQTAATKAQTDTDPTPITALTKALAAQGAQPWNEVLESVRVLVTQAERDQVALPELRDRLLSAYAELPSERLAVLMQTAFAVAQLAGIEDVDSESR